MNELINKARKELPKISVIIPVYNTQAYVGRCLDSVLNSTYRNLEVICIDDGSKDGSLSVLRQYEEKDPRIRVIACENGGVSSARNAGLEAASGEYISFVDSDDWIHPTMFEVLAGSMQDDVIVAACGNKYVPDFFIDRIVEQKPPLVYSDLVPFYSALGILRWDVWARLYRASAIAHKRFDEAVHIGEDVLFNLRLLDLSGKCVFHPAQMYYYFQRADSAVHVAQGKDFADSFRMLNETAGRLSSLPGRALFYENTIKTNFTLLYDIFLNRSAEDYHQAKVLYRREGRYSIQGLKQTRQVFWGKLIVYTLMNEIPAVYRLFRIMHDPSLLKHKRKQRQ